MNIMIIIIEKDTNTVLIFDFSLHRCYICEEFGEFLLHSAVTLSLCDKRKNPTKIQNVRRTEGIISSIFGHRRTLFKACLVW